MRGNSLETGAKVGNTEKFYYLLSCSSGSPSMFLIQFRITCHEWYCLLWTRLDPSHISHQSRELAYAGSETPSLFQDVPSLCQIHSKQRDNNNQHCGLFGFVLLFIVPTVSTSFLPLHYYLFLWLAYWRRVTEPTDKVHAVTSVTV